jgi:hypothetical protein
VQGVARRAMGAEGATGAELHIFQRNISNKLKNLKITKSSVFTQGDYY